MPEIKPGEPEDDYVKRCIPVVINEGTSQDGSQAAAICHSLWDKAREKSASGDRFWITVEQMKGLCPSCAETMVKLGLDKIDIVAFLDNWKKAQNEKDKAAGVGGDFPGNMPEQMARGLCNKIGETDEGFFTRCMDSDIRLPDGWDKKGFCAELKHYCIGHWPGEKPKNISETDAEKMGARNSRRDAERLQGIHDYAVENGAICSAKAANALKTVSESDDELRVGNYIVLFGGRDLEGLGSHNINPDGTKGEFFSPGVDLESSYTKTGHLIVDWEHGQDPDGFKDTDEDNVLGYVDWKTARKDEAGWYVERVLNRRSAYMKWLEELIKQGLVGNSTAAVSASVKKNTNGEITRWPLRRDTLTVQPMEPRMMDANVVAALKALGMDTEKLIASEAGRPDKGVQNSITEQPSKEKNAMEKEDVKALLDETNKTLLAEFEQKATAAAEIAAKKAVEEAIKALPEINRGIAVIADPADQPFASIGEQMRAVKTYEMSHGQIDTPRLKYLKTLALKAPQGMSEGVPSDGGFLLDPTLSSMFLKPVYEVGAFSSRVTRLPVGTNSNYGWINGIDSTSSADGSRWGGVTAAWRAEASTVAASHPKFRRINWELKAVDCKMFITDEELQDVAQVDAIVREAAADVLQFKINDAIVRGNGVGKPLGILNSGGRVSQVRVTTSQVNWQDLIAMWARVHPAYRANAVWFYNSEVEPELDRLAAVSHAATTEMPPRFIDYDSNGVLRIKGRPALASEFCSALGTEGDIFVAELSDYLFWEKGGIKSSQNPWLYWDTGEQAFKFTYRCDGQTAHYSPITPANGTNTQSPFVTLSASTS